MKPKLSIIVLSWNSRDITRQCLESVRDHVHDLNYELIVIDNGSHDGSANMITTTFSPNEFPQLRLVTNPTNRGYAGGNNQGYGLAQGDYILLLNSDTIIPEDTITAMVQYLDEHSAYGAVTTKLRNADSSTQYYMHRRFPTAWSLVLALLHKRWPWFQPNIVKKYLYLDQAFNTDFDIEQAAGACLLLRRTALNQIGGLFDQAHFPLYYNDVDICYRLYHAGWRIRCLTSVAITHLKGTSVRTLSFFTNGRNYVYSSLWYFRLRQRWGSFWLLRVWYTILFFWNWSMIKLIWGRSDQLE